MRPAQAHDNSGTLPVIVDSIQHVSIGCVCARNKLQKGKTSHLALLRLDLHVCYVNAVVVDQVWTVTRKQTWVFFVKDGQKLWRNDANILTHNCRKSWRRVVTNNYFNASSIQRHNT